MNLLEFISNGDSTTLLEFKNRILKNNRIRSMDATLCMLCDLIRAEIFARKGDLRSAEEILYNSILSHGHSALTQMVALVALAYIGTGTRREQYLKILRHIPPRVRKSSHPFIAVFRHVGRERASSLVSAPKYTFGIDAFAFSQFLLIRRAIFPDDE
ncbi:MAG: hypothetical protein QXL15_03225 [Candidatus Korarchaeota archaeon]